MESEDPSAYEILGIKQTASQREIHRVFRKLSRKHHPDAYGDHSDYVLISEAYNKISTPKERASYDQKLRWIHAHRTTRNEHAGNSAHPSAPPSPLVPPKLSLHLSAQGLTTTATLKAGPVDSRLATPSVIWTWDDGKSSTTRSYSDKHVYDRPGNYHVIVTADYSRGVTASASGNIAVYRPPLIHGVTVELNGVTASVFPGAINCETDTPATFTYEWFDGQGFGNRDSHTYASAGSKTLKVIASNLGGPSATFIRHFEVNWFPRILKFVYKPDGLNVRVTELELSRNATARITYDWDDGSPITTRSDHDYKGPGVYNVIVRSLNVAGQDQWIESLRVGYKPRLHDLAIERQELRVEVVSFNVESDTPVEYTFDWNDGVGSSNKSHHVYQSAGGKELRVTARNEFGVSAPVIKKFRVERLPIISALSLDIDDLEVTVTSVEIQPDVQAEFTYSWNGERYSASDSHVYTQEGPGTLSVQAENFVGTSAPFHQNLILNLRRTETYAQQFLDQPGDPVEAYKASLRVSQKFQSLNDREPAMTTGLPPFKEEASSICTAVSLLRHIPVAIAWLREANSLARVATADIRSSAGQPVSDKERIPPPRPYDLGQGRRPGANQRISIAYGLSKRLPRKRQSNSALRQLMFCLGAIAVAPIAWLWSHSYYDDGGAPVLLGLVQGLIILACLIVACFTPSTFRGWRQAVEEEQKADQRGREILQEQQDYDQRVLRWESSVKDHARQIDESQARRAAMLTQAKEFEDIAVATNQCMKQLIEIEASYATNALRKRLEDMKISVRG